MVGGKGLKTNSIFSSSACYKIRRQGTQVKKKMKTFFRVIIFGLAAVTQAVPLSGGRSASPDGNFIGKGTNELATALLQTFVEKDENLVYSPFGYSAILAIFSEGARGMSREEIATTLHFPENVETVREAYRSVLERFVGKKYSNSPEFKNWFYIYKNYTVQEELQNVLRKYYLTEVKCVNRPEDYIHTTKSPVHTDKVSGMEMPTTDEKPTLMEIKTDNMENKQDLENKSENNMDVKTKNVMESAEKVSETIQAGVKEEDKKMSESENGTIKTMSQSAESTKDMEMSVQTPESSTLENMKESENVVKHLSNTENTEMMPIKTSEKMGELSMDHFSGMTDSSLMIRGKEPESQMIIFNGLYYKGEWENPFEKKPADDSRVFYKSENEKISVSTIHSQGVFNTGNILNLDCRAIELPYKGGRYSLLVLIPNSRSGLTKLISDLSGYSFSSIYNELTEKLVDVCLPTFEINTISKPISSLNKIGLTKVTSIFNPEKADLSGITGKNSGLYVEELVQMVTFKVDAEYSKANFLTASIASSRSNVPKFQINHPFLFYLRDNVEDIIIVNGKVVDPRPKPSFYFT